MVCVGRGYSPCSKESLLQIQANGCSSVIQSRIIIKFRLVSHIYLPLLYFKRIIYISFDAKVFFFPGILENVIFAPLFTHLGRNIPLNNLGNAEDDGSCGFVLSKSGTWLGPILCWSQNLTLHVTELYYWCSIRRV